MASILDYNKALTQYSQGNYSQAQQTASPFGQNVSNLFVPKTGGTAPASTSSGSGGGGNPPLTPQPAQPQIDFDALIRPAIEGLDAAIAPLQQGYQDTVNSVNANKQTAIDTTNQSIGQQTNTVNQAKSTQKQYEQSASDAARRQYAEIQQGLQSRYGGTTGTGAFTSELAGGQSLRSLSDIKINAANAQKGLDEKLQQVQEIGRISLRDIENQAMDQTSKAKNQLDMQLADIRNQKGQLMAHKAELAANAIQAYQQTVNQVNQANAQFKQQLYMQQQAAQQSLQSAMQKASRIASAATPEDLTSYVQSLQPLVNQGYSPTVTQKIPAQEGGGSLRLSRNKSSSSSSSSSDLDEIYKAIGVPPQ